MAQSVTIDASACTCTACGWVIKTGDRNGKIVTMRKKCEDIFTTINWINLNFCRGAAFGQQTLSSFLHASVFIMGSFLFMFWPGNNLHRLSIYHSSSALSADQAALPLQDLDKHNKILSTVLNETKTILKVSVGKVTKFTSNCNSLHLFSVILTVYSYNFLVVKLRNSIYQPSNPNPNPGDF